MAIKWNIAGKATEARSNMEAISRAYDKLNANARGHRADVEGIASQVVDMQSDLENAANIMGNGGEHSEDSQEVAKDHHQQLSAYDPRRFAAEEVAKEPSTTFQG